MSSATKVRLDHLSKLRAHCKRVLGINVRGASNDTLEKAVGWLSRQLLHKCSTEEMSLLYSVCPDWITIDYLKNLLASTTKTPSPEPSDFPAAISASLAAASCSSCSASSSDGPATSRVDNPSAGPLASKVTAANKVKGRDEYLRAHRLELQGWAVAEKQRLEAMPKGRTYKVEQLLRKRGAELFRDLSPLDQAPYIAAGRRPRVRTRNERGHLQSVDPVGIDAMSCQDV